MSIINLDINYKNLFIAAITVGVIFLLFKIQSIITVFAVSFFIAYLLDPAVDFFEAKRIPRWLSILVMMGLMALLFTLFLVWFIPVAASETQYFLRSVPQYADNLLDFIHATATRLNIELDVADIKTQVSQQVSGSMNEIFSSISGLMTSIGSAISTIIHISLVPILVFYFLRDFDKLNEKLFRIIENRTEKDYKRYFQEFDRILSAYFRGQLLIAVILGVLYTTVLLIVGVKPAVIVGMVSGILSVVPYLGFIIAFATSVMLAALQFGDVLHPVMVIVGLSAVQAVEGNFLTPKIIGESLGLHPTAVIFALLTGGSLFGIGGMIIALPLAAFLRVLAKERLIS